MTEIRWNERDRWWANNDGKATMYYFATEAEARAFVEVMIRLDT